MNLNHNEVQLTTGKMLLSLPFQDKQQCETNRKKWVLESGWIPGSTTYLVGCMTTFKLFNVTCAMRMTDLPYRTVLRIK